MSTGYPGGFNTYVPTLDISGKLQIGFSRNTKDFPVNQYIKLTKVTAPRGYYVYFNPLDIARIELGDINSANWAPGTPRPVGFHKNRGFEFKDFTTVRKNFPTALDKMSVDVAAFDVQSQYANDLAQEAMTFRAFWCSQVLTTSANYPGSHVASATSLGGGFLDTGTTANPLIKRAFDAASRVIQQDTLGRIRYRDLTIVMNNTTAQKLSLSREIREYVMQQSEAWKEITMDSSNLNAQYGLPKTLYGYRVVVEDTYYNGYNRGNASEAGSAVFPDNTIAMITRSEDLESAGPDVPSFSTLHLFSYEDMTVEAKDDSWDRLLYMSVTDNIVPQIVAPVSGFLVTNVFS